jgi:putative acyl-CoA dehydrogenase
MRRNPESVDAFVTEVQAAAGADRRFDAALDGLLGELAGEPSEAVVRSLTGRMAVLLQASLLLRYSPAVVADAFVASRIEAPAPVYGAIPGGIDAAAIVDRALPA